MQLQFMKKNWQQAIHALLQFLFYCLKQILETHKSLKDDTNGVTDNNLSAKPCMLFFIQTLQCLLYAGTISRVRFWDLFGPVTGVNNTIM